MMTIEKQAKYVTEDVASRSVPGSRRNSNDESRSLFEKSFSHYDTPIDFLTKPPSRSFSIDVGSINSQSSSFFDDNTTATTLFQQNNYLRSRYLFNNNTNYGLFATSDLELEASKSNWNNSAYSDNNSSSIGQSAFYAQPARRFSHGWLNQSTPTTTTSTTTSSTNTTNNKAILSNCDLQMTTAALSAYHITSEPCQQFRQYGYCTTKDTCTYSHVTESVPSLRYSNSSSTCNTQQEKKSDSDVAVTNNNNSNKFAGLQLIEFQDKLFELCKDQHGCRFLQLKLEESKSNVDMIYKEIHLHFVELMTDPFGNYLCQKLLEKCDDTQRSCIVQVIAPQFLKICLSMHGTRAVQKLIEFLSTKRQIQAVIVALEPNVVALIKDLNGNHVVQKCLHKLSPEHNQFIYDTVSRHCIEVASHKHGCCVYQRCIDHATPTQKTQLVNVITQHALPLVQDPFGNYVVQYVLELGDAKYSDNLIRRFIDPIRELSVQKFSSNVIEKCIRVAERDTKRQLIAGITNHPQMEKFLRDSYANYVIQTCLDFAEQDQRAQFIDRIRPLLPSIRNTPYGKRIYSKIHNNR